MLYFDACLMGMIEDAYEIKDYMEYIVASENLGWSVFAYDDYVASITDSTTPRQLAQNVADAYIAALYDYPATVSALDLSAIEDVGNAVDTPAQALEAYLDGSNVSQMISIRDNAQTLDSRDYLLLDSTDEYVDLYHLAELVKVGISDTTVQSTTPEVMDAVVAVSTRSLPYSIRSPPPPAAAGGFPVWPPERGPRGRASSGRARHQRLPA